MLLSVPGGPGASWYGNAHDPISGLIYASLVLAQLALARRFRRDPGWRARRPWLLTSAAATGVLLIAYAAAVTGPAAAILQRAAVTLPQAAVAPSRPGSCGAPAGGVRSDSVGKASRKKGQRRQGIGQSRADFELRHSFARLEANPSPALAAHAWGGGSKPEPAAIPTWPDDSAGDRFFNTQGTADAAEAPPIVGTTMPTPEEMAAIPELWVVATNALVRAVVLDGLTVNHPAVSTVIALLEPVVKQELAYYADETTWDEYPESDVPLRLLGDEVLMDATWAIAGDDSLASVLALLERRLDTAFDTPGRPASLTGRAAAEALIRAFPDHFECRAPGDEACLERLRATGRTSSNPLCDLVRDKVIAPEDALPVGLTILAALADLARTSAFSVLDAST
jgi:hypothetical protein